MRVVRWLSLIGAPLCVALAVSASTTAVGARLTVLARSCPAASAFLAGTAASPRGAAIAADMKLATGLDSRGAVSARTLSLSTAIGRQTLGLATESFASGAVSNVVVFGQTTATGGSSVRAIDLQTGCSFDLYSTKDVVRGALIDPQLRSLFVHTVNAATRADLGVTRVELATGATVRVVPPAAASEHFGPTFATLLRWSDDGDALAVQSCGLAACRTRVLNFATNAIDDYSQVALGEIVGLDASSIRAHTACETDGCPLVTLDRRTGKEIQP